MARPEKRGIDYFPLDVLYYRDEKMQFITALFDLEGESVVKRIWCRIYEENGYYMKWDEDIAILFTAHLQSRSCGLEKVKQVVSEALKRGLFDKTLFEQYGVLTSRRVQHQYLAATKERKRVEMIREYVLLKNEELNSNVVFITINPGKNQINPSDNPESLSNNTKRKEKEKETKEKKKATDVCQYYREHMGSVTPKIVEEISMYEGLLEPALVCEAIDQAAIHHAKWPYAKAILERCRRNNIRTAAAFYADNHKPQKQEKTAEELLKERGYI